MCDDDIPKSETKDFQIPAPVTINVHGNQNVIAALGGVNSQISNHLQIVQETNPEIANVLRELAAAVAKANLQENQSQQLLSRIDTLAKEISAKPPESEHWSIVDRAKNLVEYVVSIVSINHGVHYLLEHSDKIMPLVTAAFGG